MNKQILGMTDLRKSLVTYSSHKFDDTNDVNTTYLGYYKSKGEERTFPVDNHIPLDGRGVTETFLMDNTPMHL